jgi:uncharacterized protein (DUF924 family)
LTNVFGSARFSTQLKLIESSQATGADILAVAKPSTPQQWMSLIILLDQLPRNCFRGARVDIAYTFFDGLALEVAFRAIDFGVPRAPEVRFRLAYVFWFYMPLEHSENMEVQEALANAHISMWQDFQQLMEGSVEELNSDTVNCRTVLLKREHSFEKFKDTIRGICDDHRDLIRRFGRFPYRNEALGRSTTDEELQFLEQR